MNLELAENRIIRFTTQRVGRADLKRDGGTHRGRHVVEVTMLVGPEYTTLAAIDLAKGLEADHDQVKENLLNQGYEFKGYEYDMILHGRSSHRKKGRGILGPLQDSSHGINPFSVHEETYRPHPSGVRGVYVHRENEGVYVSGILISEKVIDRDPNGDARKNTPTKDALLKKAIQKELGFMTSKWRQYKLPAGVKINGVGKDEVVNEEESQGLAFLKALQSLLG